MGLMKSYFDYYGGIACGIPSVTLLGTKADWQSLLDKTERIKEFGNQTPFCMDSYDARSEPTEYYNRLQPILTHIVQSFDNPDSTDTRDFWNNIVQAKIKHSRLCGAPPKQYIVSGWILGLFYWDTHGEASYVFSGAYARAHPETSLGYDGVLFGSASLDNIPIGYAKAKFTMLNSHGRPADKKWKGWVLAGSVGKRITTGPAPYGHLAALKEVNPARYEGLVPRSETSSSSFLSFLCSLNCFRGGRKRMVTDTPAGVSVEVLNKKQVVSRQPDSGLPAHKDHSTIQALSGWFLFGPDKEVGPFYVGEEMQGPTVHALESCGSIEHIALRPTHTKYQLDE